MPRGRPKRERTEYMVCNHCKKTKHHSQFPRTHFTCKECYAGKERMRQDSGRNKRFNDLIKRCFVTFVMLVVTGIYSHDYISGRNRICIYESVYGDHAVTIDAMRMCPLTMEFEV